MAELGVNADSRFSTVDLVASGARWARFPLRMNEDIGDWLVQAGTRGLQTVGVWDSHPDSLGDDESLWPERLAAGWRRYGSLLTVWQTGNEPDAPEGSPSSWVMDQARMSRLMRLAAEVMPAARRWGPGLSGGVPAWSESLPWETVSAICAHPYAKYPGTPELEAMIAGYSDIARRAGIDLVVSEFDSRTSGMAAALGADSRIETALAFCWSDEQVFDFGLLDRDGRRKSAYADFLMAASRPIIAGASGPMPKPELVRLIVEVAAEQGLPPRELLMLALAESNLVSDAWNGKDEPYGSAGAFQQNLRYAPEWREGEAALPQIEPLKHIYMTDVRHAAAVASDLYLRRKQPGDSPVDAACRYNNPSILPLTTNQNRWLYERSWDRSYALLEDPNMAEFKLGFKAKADELGADVVGKPLEDQDYQRLVNGGEIAYQFTDKGVMVYSKKANKVHFLPGR